MTAKTVEAVDVETRIQAAIAKVEKNPANYVWRYPTACSEQEMGRIAGGVVAGLQWALRLVEEASR